MHFRFHFNFSCSITFLQFYWLCSLTKLTDCCRCKISLDENGRWHAAQRHITTNGSNIQQRFISFMKIFYLIHKMKNITIHLRSPIINMHLTLQQTGSDFITDKEAPSSNTSIPNKRDAGDFMLSASLWEVLINSPIEEKIHVGFAKKRGFSSIGLVLSTWETKGCCSKGNNSCSILWRKPKKPKEGRVKDTSILMTSQSRKTRRKSSISRFAHWGNQVETLWT